MNIILFDENELKGERLILTDRRFEHIKNVIRPKPSDRLSVGLRGGRVGTGIVEEITGSYAALDVSLTESPAAKLNVHLVIALCRPKVMRRVIFKAVCAGVTRIDVINSWRVEKSFWQSPYISEDKVKNTVTEALEQAKDTVDVPVYFHRFFTDFVRGELRELAGKKSAFVAHPYGASGTDILQTPAVLAVGPEGGFIDKEIETFEDVGFESFSLGGRILNVETAVPYLLAKF